MPEQRPRELQQRLAWSLWKLDVQNIKSSLNSGANPYTLHTAIDISEMIPQGARLSPFAIILEGYLARIYLEEDLPTIFNALDSLFLCVDFLIRNNISVDEGVLTLGSKPTMRGFILESLARLNTERISQGHLDEEGNYALHTLEKIQKLIDSYQLK